MRLGDYKWDEQNNKVRIVHASRFIGGHISFSIIGMFVTLIMFSVLFIPIYCKYTYILLWEVKIWLLMYFSYNY